MVGAKANATDVYTKTDMETYLFFKGERVEHNFQGTVSASTLTATGDTRLNGHLTVIGTDKVTKAKQTNEHPPASQHLATLFMEILY